MTEENLQQVTPEPEQQPKQQPVAEPKIIPPAVEFNLELKFNIKTVNGIHTVQMHTDVNTAMSTILQGIEIIKKSVYGAVAKCTHEQLMVMTAGDIIKQTVPEPSI